MRNRKPSVARRKCRYCRRVERPGPIHCCARRHREATWNAATLSARLEEERRRPVPY